MCFYSKHVRVLNSLFLCFCSVVSGLGFLGCVCMHMLLACVHILVVCVCIQMSYVHMPCVCAHILLPRNSNSSYVGFSFVLSTYLAFV